MVEGEMSGEKLTGEGTLAATVSEENLKDKTPIDGAEEGVTEQDKINLELTRLAREYGVQTSKLGFLLNNGVPLIDLEELIHLKLHTITTYRGFSADPNDFTEVEMTYEQLLRLYKMSKKAESEDWCGLAERIVEHALASEDGDPEDLENQGHWMALNRSMDKFERVGERMFGDEY